MVPRILTLDEQITLYRAWHDAGDAKALAELVSCIRSGLDAEGRRFARKWKLPEDDILSSIGEAIVEKIQVGDWDPSRGSLATLLWHTVRWKMRVEGGMHQTIIDRSDRVWRFGALALQDPETAREALSKKLGFRVGDVTLSSIVAMGNAQQAIRLDAAISEGGEAIGDVMASPDPGPEELTGRAEVAAVMRQAVAAVRAGLTDRQQAILDRRILPVDDPETLDSLSRAFGISRERVRQVELRILGKLRQGLKAAGVTPEAVLR